MDTREKIARWLREKAYARDDWDQIPDMWRAGWRNKADEVLSLIGPCAECTARKADVSETRDALHVMKEAMLERDAYKAVIRDALIDLRREDATNWRYTEVNIALLLNLMSTHGVSLDAEPVEDREPQNDDSKWPMDAANQGIVKPEPKPLPSVPDDIEYVTGLRYCRIPEPEEPQ